MNNKLSIAVTPSVKLRTSQAKLYEFVLQKYKSGKPINLVEVIDLYTKYGNRNTMNGVPYAYGYTKGDYRLIPLKGGELRTWAISWFIHNIGIFVVKGLLTAIPTMELSELQIEAGDG